jgi:hypothetical protein
VEGWASSLAAVGRFLLPTQRVRYQYQYPWPIRRKVIGRQKSTCERKGAKRCAAG